MDPNELRQKRAKLVKEARSIMDRVQEEKRDGMSAEEEERFDRLMADADALEKQIEKEERLRNLEAGLDDNGDLTLETREKAAANQEPTEMRAWNRYLRSGMGVLTESELRDLSLGADTEGGFLSAPQQFVQRLIQAVDDEVFVRRLATVQQITTAESLGVPTLDSDMDDADWTTELRTGNKDAGLRFGKRELRPHPLAKRVLVSNTLLRRAALSPEAIVRARLAYKFSAAEENGFLTGDGVDKPLGVFVASSDGIPASRDVDVSTGTTATEITGDGLINAKYALKPAYWRRARWLFHRDVIREIRKLKDSQGQYLWQPGLQGGAPDRIVDLPYDVSEFAPSAFTADAYIGLLADWSNYWIVDSLAMQVQRLVELYAETNQTGFIGRAEVDGMPVLAEAFVRLKLAS